MTNEHGIDVCDQCGSAGLGEHEAGINAYVTDGQSEELCDQCAVLERVDPDVLYERSNPSTPISQHTPMLARRYLTARFDISDVSTRDLHVLESRLVHIERMASTENVKLAMGIVIDPPLTFSRTHVRNYSYPTIVETFGQHFYDSSYGNDVTDSITFALGDTGYTVWIDAESPLDRHGDFGFDHDQPISPSNRPPSRFAVCRLEAPTGIYTSLELADGRQAFPHGGDKPTIRDTLDERNLVDGPPMFETDDPDALVAFLRSQRQ